jgi:ABC-2 type transport system permease protein
MMLSAMIKKELLLVLRDRHALMALFVMPAIFILIMSVAMRDQFSVKNLHFTLVVKDADTSEMSIQLLKFLKEDKNLQILNDKAMAQFSVIIPKDYGENNKKRVEIDVQDAIKNNQIKAFKAIFSKYILKTKLEFISNNLKKYAPKAAKSLASIEVRTDKLYNIKYNHMETLPNSTQQSVPAWIVFGMFFIIIPMSTIYVNERKQNTLARLNSMNVSVVAMTLSKSIPYFIINQVQVWIMLAVGIFLIPFFDTPALSINGSIFAILEISMSLSIAAIGVSTLIAVSASSSEQATTIGGILNILLGAIGGVMVPKFIMPEIMQHIAEFSPMSWGLDGFLEIFLKAADASEVINYSLKLLLFGGVTLIISMIILQIRIKKGL